MLWVQGDEKCYAIAAASILAKVTRDRLMEEYDRCAYWIVNMFSCFDSGYVGGSFARSCPQYIL